MKKNLKDNLIRGLVGLLVVGAGCEAPRRPSLEEQVTMNITDTPKLHETNPSISVDGKKIVFEVDDKGNKEIFLKNLETGQSMNISNSPAKDYQPSISADGKKVIFLSDRTGSPEIHMVNLADIFYARGLQTKANGYIENAISYFEQAVYTDPLHIPSHQELGRLYDEREDYDKAIKEFDTIANLYTDEFMRFLAIFKESPHEEQQLKTLTGDIIIAYHNLALTYTHKGNEKAAANVYYNLGMIFEEIGVTKLAIAEFKKGMSIDPTPSVDTYNLLGRLYGKIEDYEKAGQTLRKALEIDSNSVRTHSNLGLVYLKQGLEENAKVEFQRVLEIEPNSTEVHQNFAVYYHEKQDYQNALNQWQKLAKIDPNYLNLKRNIDLAKKKLKEVDQVVGQEYNLSDLPESQAYIDKAKVKITKLPPQAVNVRHILIAAPLNIDDQTRRQRKAKAEEIREQLLKGADFAQMAARYSDCPSKAEGGSLGTFRRGKMIKPFEDAAFSQKVGEIGSVIETRYGYHIIQVMNRLVQTDSVLLPEAQETRD